MPEKRFSKINSGVLRDFSNMHTMVQSIAIDEQMDNHNDTGGLPSSVCAAHSFEFNNASSAKCRFTAPSL